MFTDFVAYRLRDRASLNHYALPKLKIGVYSLSGDAHYPGIKGIVPAYIDVAGFLLGENYLLAILSCVGALEGDFDYAKKSLRLQRKSGLGTKLIGQGFGNQLASKTSADRFSIHTG